MRTNIVIDDKLMAEAMKATGSKDQKRNGLIQMFGLIISTAR